MMSFFSDPSTWVLVAFILFVIIALVIKAPAMITDLLDGEIKKIKDELDNARKLKEEANSLLAQHERKIQNADEEAEKIISQAKEISANQEAQSKIKAEEYVRRAEQQAIDKIKRAEKLAIAKINDHIVSNSIKLSEKIISENIDENSSKRLIQQSIQQISKLK